MKPLWRATLLAAGIALAGQSLAAPSPDTAPEPAAARVILLGTGGGPIDRKNRSQPANLLDINGHRYIIDAGAGVVRQIARAGYQPSDINTVFITHHHVDHNAGLEPLISFLWIDRNMHKVKTPKVEIYGPPATTDLVDASLKFLSASERIFSSSQPMMPAAPMFTAHDIKKNGVVYQDSNVCVQAVENDHFHFPVDSAAAKFGDKSYAYRFNTAMGSIVFTGDTGPSERVTKLAEGADLLVSEVISLPVINKLLSKLPHSSKTEIEKINFHMAHEHLVPEEVGKMAAKAKVKAVLLTHIVPGLDNEADMTPYIAGVHKYYNGPVMAGKDLFEYDLFQGKEPRPVTCQ